MGVCLMNQLKRCPKLSMQSIISLNAKEHQSISEVYTRTGKFL